MASRTSRISARHRLAGLSFITVLFDDESDNLQNRQQVLEKLTLVNLPPGLNPQIGPDFSPAGQIYFYTLQSTNPQYDVMDLKALQDWVVFKHLMSVPNVASVSIFGGETREYQVQVDPDKLVAYGLTMAQVEQALAANNVNGGGSFIEKGQQAYNVRAVGLMQNTDDIGATVLKAQNGTPVRVRDVAVVTQGPKIRLGRLGKAIRHDGRHASIDNDDVVEGIVQMRKGAEAEAVLRDIDVKVEFLNERVLPPGVKIVPHIDRDDLVHLTTHTVLHNLTEGILLVVLVLFFFLGNVRSALIVAITIPFSLFFASILLDLRHIPANLLSLGALDFGMIVEGAAVMVENIQRRLENRMRSERQHRRDHSLGRPRSAAAGVLRHRHHHHYLPADLHPAAGGGTAVQAHGLDGRLRAAGRAPLFDAPRAGAGQLSLPQRGAGLGESGCQLDHGALRADAGVDHWRAARSRWRRRSSSSRRPLYLGFGGVIGSEFLPHLDEGSIWARGTLVTQHRPDRGQRDHGPGAADLRQLSRGDAGRVAGWALRRRHRRHRLLQHGILRRPQAARRMAPAISRPTRSC